MSERIYCRYVEKLLDKHGPVKGNYFADSGCKIPNKAIKRGNDGLFIHHIDEDKAVRLSDPRIARQNPLSYQHADRLVYCNYMEHCWLHYFIYQEVLEGVPLKGRDVGEVQGIGGLLKFMIPTINRYFSSKHPERIFAQWELNALGLVQYDEWLRFLRLCRLTLKIPKKYLLQKGPKVKRDLGW